MKKSFITLLCGASLAVAAVAVSSCTFDDSDILSRLEALEKQVSELQSAANAGDYITGIAPIKDEDGLVIGYTISFEKAQPINVLYGKDGNDGETIKGDDGKSAYEIAVANGFQGTVEEWLESLKGSDATSFFKDIVITDTYVKFVTEDDQTIVIPRADAARTVDVTPLNCAAKGNGETIDITFPEAVTDAEILEGPSWVSVSAADGVAKLSVASNESDKVRLATVTIKATAGVASLKGTVYVGQAASGSLMIYDSFREKTLSDAWVGNRDAASLNGSALLLQTSQLNDSEQNHGKPLYYNQVISMCNDSDVYNKVCVQFDFLSNGAQCALMAYNAVGFSNRTYEIPAGTMCYDCWVNDVFEGKEGDEAGQWWCLNADDWDAMGDKLTDNGGAPQTKWMRMKMYNGYDYEDKGVGRDWGGYSIYTLVEDETGTLTEQKCILWEAKHWWGNNPRVDVNNPAHGGYMGLWVRNNPNYPTGQFRNFCISYDNN